jgi:ethanolamine utilization protein EutP (predicted NTPase)
MRKQSQREIIAILAKEDMPDEKELRAIERIEKRGGLTASFFLSALREENGHRAAGAGAERSGGGF